MGEKLATVVTDSWTQEVVSLATLLDPAVKLRAFVTAEEKQSAVSLLKKYAASYSKGSPNVGEAISVDSAR